MSARKKSRFEEDDRSPEQLEAERVRDAFLATVKRNKSSQDPRPPDGQCVAQNTIAVSITYRYQADAPEFNVFMRNTPETGGSVDDSFHPSERPRNTDGKPVPLKPLGAGTYRVYRQDRSKDQWINDGKFMVAVGSDLAYRVTELHGSQDVELGAKLNVAAHTVCAVYDLLIDMTMAQFKPEALLLVPEEYGLTINPKKDSGITQDTASGSIGAIVDKK
jgi:hypothetical protein